MTIRWNTSERLNQSNELNVRNDDIPRGAPDYMILLTCLPR
jgi:hypothetical protein